MRDKLCAGVSFNQKNTNQHGELSFTILPVLPGLLKPLFAVEVEAKELNWGEEHF